MAKKAAIIILTGWFLVSAAGTAATSAQPLTEFMSEAEVREKIERWQKAREAYYAIWLGKEVGIRVEQEASDFVVRGYAGRTLPEEILAVPRPVARAVIQTDLEVLLNRAFFESVRKTYRAIANFFALVTQGEAREVRVSVEDVQNAVRAENCNIIPCNPKVCNPDT